MEGRGLKEISEPFFKHIHTAVEQFFVKWTKEVQETSFNTEEKIFKVIQKRDKLELVVNYEERMFTLFKEERHLKYLGFKIPVSITLKSDDCRSRLFPRPRLGYRSTGACASRR